jgi:2,3,4,5-tetrahydropyridine-2-carboxylate N-succinyltransferase
VVGDEVVVDERAKRAILLSFKVLPMEEGANGGFYVHDRVPLKTSFPGVGSSRVRSPGGAASSSPASC